MDTRRPVLDQCETGLRLLENQSETVGAQSLELSVASSDLVAVCDFEEIGCNAFQRKYGLTKNQFYELKEVLDVDTASGLSPAMHKAFKLLAEKRGWIEIQPDSVDAEPAQNTSVDRCSDEFVATEIVINDGNHRKSLDLNLPQSFDLGALRSEDSVFTVKDPLALAEKALAAMDAVSNAMKQDLQDQKVKLQATQKAADQISARAAELRLEKLQYQIETRVTAELQNPATAKLQKGLGVLGNDLSPDPSNGSAV